MRRETDTEKMSENAERKSDGMKRKEPTDQSPT